MVRALERLGRSFLLVRRKLAMKFFFPLTQWGLELAIGATSAAIGGLDYLSVFLSVFGACAYVSMSVLIDLLLLPASVAAALTAALIHFVPEPSAKGASL
jgi:hypothetical protein